MSKTCIDCGKEIGKTSNRCSSCSHKGNKNGMFKPNKIKKENFCMDCNCVIHKKSKRCRKCALKARIYKHTETIKKSIRLRQMGDGNSSYIDGRTLVKKFCIDCDKPIIYSAIRCKSCSHKGSLNINFNANKEPNVCIVCGSEISRATILYGSKRCKLCAFQLSDNPNWNNGSSFEPYPLGWTKTFKEQIRFRDGYKCQLCGIPECECKRKLCVHHIDYDKNNLNVNNLISLCIKCHSKTNGNREYWINYFKEETYSGKKF